MLKLDGTYKPPKPVFVNANWDNGKLAFKFDPKRGVIELSERGVTKLFDLAELASKATIIEEKTN